MQRLRPEAISEFGSEVAKWKRVSQTQPQTSRLTFPYLGFLVRKFGIIIVMPRIIVRSRRINICKVHKNCLTHNKCWLYVTIIIIIII